MAPRYSWPRPTPDSPQSRTPRLSPRTAQVQSLGYLGKGYTFRQPAMGVLTPFSMVLENDTFVYLNLKAYFAHRWGAKVLRTTSALLTRRA